MAQHGQVLKLRTRRSDREGYATEGRGTFHLLNRQLVWNVQVVDGWAYAHRPSAVGVVDVGRMRVIGNIAPPS